MLVAESCEGPVPSSLPPALTERFSTLRFISSFLLTGPLVRTFLRGRVRVLETSFSLLERLQQSSDPEAWQRLVELYTPYIRGWLRHHAVQPADVEDLTQEVLRSVVRSLPDFQHDLRRGAFRRWLRTITVNHLRSFWRVRRPATGGDIEQRLNEMEDPSSDLSRQWDEEHDRHVLRRLLELIEPEFEPATWRAFRLVVLEGRPAGEAAAELGISANAARIAKSRVLSRLRQESDGLVD
jgi:RNA polymerase sigma-70 factor (ECF subfamily)